MQFHRIKLKPYVHVLTSHTQFNIISTYWEQQNKADSSAFVHLKVMYLKAEVNKSHVPDAFQMEWNSICASVYCKNIFSKAFLWMVNSQLVVVYTTVTVLLPESCKMCYKVIPVRNRKLRAGTLDTTNNLKCLLSQAFKAQTSQMSIFLHNNKVSLSFIICFQWWLNISPETFQFSEMFVKQLELLCEWNTVLALSLQQFGLG